MAKGFSNSKPEKVRLVKVGKVPNSGQQLVVVSHGKQRTGKTHLISTMPDLGVVPLDRNTRWTLAKDVAWSGRQVVMPEEDFIRAAAELARRQMPQDESISIYRRHLDKIKDALYQMYEDGDIRSVAVDTGTDLWEAILFAFFGRTSQIMPRDRGAANAEMSTLLNMCPKHLLVTHRSTEIWVNDKPSGAFKLSGYTHISYCCTVCVEHYRLATEDILELKKAIKDGVTEIDKDDLWEGQFAMRVFDCQARPSLKGGPESVLVGERCTFPALGVMVFPDSEEGDWE